MFYEKELRFLCDVLKKLHIRISVVSANDYVSAVVDTELDAIFGNSVYENVTVHKFVGNLEPKTLYKYTDMFGIGYMYLLLPDVSKSTLLFIGPYLSFPLASKQLLEIGEENSVPPQSQGYLEEYFASIPIIDDVSPVMTMLNTFCEKIWDTSSFSIVDVAREHKMPVSPINEVTRSDDFNDILLNMKTMEKRYEFENEIMRAVTLGQTHKETILFSSFSDQMFEKRVADPLRNTKNYCVIMNTLLRKAAEEGGVHPVYLDRMSSKYAAKIEQMSSLSERGELMGEMFRSYCRLVRKHSMKDFSLLVQKTILLIDSDLSADLSLSSLAQSQNVSAAYLSTTFKKETGKTVSEYIREKRMKHAAHLLSTTKLQVQTVALYCGIMDVQYFSKTFKREMGMTPKEYREAMR